MYCSFVNIGNADIDEFHSLIKLFTESEFIIIIIIIITIISIIVREMLHYKLSHGVYDQEICGRLPEISKTNKVQGLQVYASSYFQMNQPTRCSSISSLLLV